MTTAADRAIRALRTGHDNLTDLVVELSPEALSGPSAASEWSIAAVLSHLGSGAEINLAGLEASMAGDPPPASDFNHGVWDRWNAMGAEEQAESFVKSNEALVVRYESLDEQTRAELKIAVGFLPAPVDVATAAAFRLSEFTLHAWDVAVAGNADAALAPEALEDLLAVGPYLFGWLGKPGTILDGRSIAVGVQITEPDRDFGLAIADKVALTDTPDNADATLRLPAESWLRLVAGRLAPAHTPGSAIATGAVTLDQLRQIFPGY